MNAHALQPSRVLRTIRASARAAGPCALGLGLLVLLGAVGCEVDSRVASAEQTSTELWQPEPVRENNLRVVTFNIRNFPEMPAAPEADPPAEPPPIPVSYELRTNIDALLGLLARLDFDVMGVQEIIDTALFGEVIAQLSARTGRTYEVVFAQNAAGNPQHVGIVVDTGRVRLAWLEELPELDVTGTLRPGLSARVESVRADGIDFGLMVLHLVSGSGEKRAALRAEQAARAAAIVARQIEDTGDDDYIVLGDLNSAREEAEFGQLDAAFATGTALGRQLNLSGCTSYWIKAATNPLVRPSWLDHVYVGSLGELDPQVPLLAGAHCAQRHCEAFESTDAESGSTFWDVSDHCPVYFELADRDDDPPT